MAIFIFLNPVQKSQVKRKGEMDILNQSGPIQVKDETQNFISELPALGIIMA